MGCIPSSKRNYANYDYLYPVKISFRNEEKIKTFSNRQRKRKRGNPSLLYQLYRLMEVPYSDMKDSKNQESVKPTRESKENQNVAIQ